MGPDNDYGTLGSQPTMGTMAMELWGASIQWGLTMTMGRWGASIQWGEWLWNFGEPAYNGDNGYGTLGSQPTMGIMAMELWGAGIQWGLTMPIGPWGASLQWGQ